MSDAKNLIRQRIPLIMRITRFLIVGLGNFFVELLLFNLLFFVFGTNLVLAKVLSSLVAILNAYILNKLWVFKQKGASQTPREITIFFGVNILCMALSTVILAWLSKLHVLFDILRGIGINELTAINLMNFLSIVIVMVIRYTSYQKIIFTQSPTD